MRGIRVALGVSLLFVLTAAPASADAVLHSQHIALRPVAGAPLTNGFVENIHANGPNVFAHEVYVLSGALPNTEFTVSIAVYFKDPSCTSPPISFTTATLTTSAGGGGKADVFFTPDQVAQANLGNATHGAIWTLSAGGTPVYRTGCTTIVLD